MKISFPQRSTWFYKIDIRITRGVSKHILNNITNQKLYPESVNSITVHTYITNGNLYNKHNDGVY